MTQRDLLRVILWMTGALLSFSAMAVSVRGLAKVLHVFEILAIRNASGLVILLAIGLAQPHLLRTLTLHRARLQLARNTIHFGAQYLWMLSVTLLPLATVFALEFTMPAYAAILAVVFLGENITAGRIGVVVLGFLGVLVILRPGIASFNPAALSVLTAAFGFAVSLIQTKALTTSETTYRHRAVDERRATAAGADRERAQEFPQPRRGTSSAAHGCRDLGTRLAFLPDPGVPVRRCHRGGAARLHAHPAHRLGRLVALWRGA